MISDGVLLVDKPAGLTSHDVVARERRALRERARSSSEAPRGPKVGHAGTLDPFATGLLLVLVGRATRAQRFLMALPKTYEVTARLGWTSTTGDPDGEIAPGRMPAEPLALPTGRIRQRPPAYSAVKVGGRRAYALARAGEPVELAERDVVIHRFDRTGPDRFLIECSSGTYVRALIADLGDAYCTELRRTRIGPFDVAGAGTFVPLAEALGFLPEVRLTGDAARRATHGGQVHTSHTPDTGVVGCVDLTPSVVRLVDEEGLIALAEARGDGVLKPVVGFRG